jgi:hypothetical protein
VAALFGIMSTLEIPLDTGTAMIAAIYSAASAPTREIDLHSMDHHPRIRSWTQHYLTLIVIFLE